MGQMTENVLAKRSQQVLC